MSVTIYDIAKKMGYAPATVSKALNNKMDISEKTRLKIQKCAKEMGYSPNSQAVALTTNKTWNIGVLSVDSQHSGLTHYMFSQVLNSIKDAAEQQGYDITFISENIGGKETSYLEHARYRRCDGVIIACIDFEKPSVYELINSDLPVVAIDHDYKTCGVVSSNNVDGMRRIVNYLKSKGHKDILYIYGEPSDVTTYRCKAFEETFAKYDDNGKSWIVEGVYYSKSSSYDNTMKFYEEHNMLPSAIIYPDDYAAIGGMRAIRDLGFKIPDDVSVVGYDGIELGALIEPSITTVKQDTVKIGQEAVNNLMTIISNKAKGIEMDSYEHAIVPVEFIERSSSK